MVGYASTDVTHLLAELVENAANFSPKEAPITLMPPNCSAAASRSTSPTAASA